VDPAPLTPDYCTCAIFLDEWGDGRIEGFEDCPRHWRIYRDEFEVHRESQPVDVDELLALVQG